MTHKELGSYSCTQWYVGGRTGDEIVAFLTLLFSLIDLFLGESGIVVSGLDDPGRTVQV